MQRSSDGVLSGILACYGWTIVAIVVYGHGGSAFGLHTAQDGHTWHY
jgi:hypothetical protein